MDSTAQITRKDGRLSTQIRPIHSTQSLLTAADGSSQFAFDDKLSIVCSITGPTEVKIKDEKLDKATIKTIFKPLEGYGGMTERYHERLLRQVAEYAILTSMHPRTLIQICFQTLAANGSLTCAAVNALVLALVDAGVPTRSLFSAVACVISEDGQLLLDPTTEEIEQSRSSHVFAFDAIDYNVIACESLGNFTEEEYFACLDICQTAARTVISFIRTAIEKKLSL